MADNTSAIIADTNKTAEQYMTEAESMYIVPKLVRISFPDLVKLIFETESMDDEEREYWLQIMPIMTEEQIKKFRDILVNERSQLEKLDNEYDNEMKKINKSQKPVRTLDEAKIKERFREIKRAESESQATEQSAEDALLEKLKGL